jgi:hypothetical protein
MKTSSFFFALATLSASLTFTSCSKESDAIAPATAATENSSDATKARPLPCDDFDYHMDITGNGNRCWRQDVTRDDYMTRTLLDLNYEVYMTQTKYTITPSGIETSVWEGVIPVNSDIPHAKSVFKTGIWNECGKYYDSECEKFSNGKMILTLVHNENNGNGNGNGKK